VLRPALRAAGSMTGAHPRAHPPQGAVRRPQPLTRAVTQPMAATREQPGNPQGRARRWHWDLLLAQQQCVPQHGRERCPTPALRQRGASSPFPDTAFRTLPTKELPARYGVRHAGVRQAGVQARRGVCQPGVHHPGVRGAGVQALLLDGASSSFREEGENSAGAQLVTTIHCPSEPGGSRSHAMDSRRGLTLPRPPPRPCPQGRAPTCSCRAALRQAASSCSRVLLSVMSVEHQETLSLLSCKSRSSALVFSSSWQRAACSSLRDDISLSGSSVPPPQCGMGTFPTLASHRDQGDRCKPHRFRQLPPRWGLLGFPTASSTRLGNHAVTGAVPPVCPPPPRRSSISQSGGVQAEVVNRVGTAGTGGNPSAPHTAGCAPAGQPAWTSAWPPPPAAACGACGSPGQGTVGGHGHEGTENQGGPLGPPSTVTPTPQGAVSN